MTKIKNIIGLAAVLLAGITINLKAGVPSSFDFPISTTLNGSTTSNATVTITNGTAMPVQSSADLTITATVTPTGVNVLRSNAVVGLDSIWGPSSTQRTTTQHLQCSVPLNSTNPITVTFYFNRTNFYGASGLAVDSFGAVDSTNVALLTLSEVSGNWVP